MPSPRNPEIGLRQTKRLRAGMDFPNWEGVNREMDPGAIRDSQIQTGINVRIEGNEIVNRGGMTKIHSAAMTGCVYGFIDVPEGATSLLLVAHDDGTPGEARLDRYYSESSPSYNTAMARAATLQPTPTTLAEFVDDTKPRRSLARANGGLYQFGHDADNEPTLFRIILPERTTTLTGTTDFLNQMKLEARLALPEFASWVETSERFSDEILLPVLYIGSTSTGKVYRWDGITFVAETSNLIPKRHIVTKYQEDVYAVCGSNMRKRGENGLWGTNIALGVTKTWCAAEEYQTKLYICGDQKLLSWDGTAIVDLSAALFAVTFATGVIVDARCFGDKIYFLVGTSGITQYVEIVSYDGTTFTDILRLGADGPLIPGCLEAFGNHLWYTYKDNENNVHPTLNWYDGTTFGPATLGPSDDAERVMSDMVAF